MTLLDKIQYDIFLAEEMVHQAEMQRYVEECIAIGEGSNTIENMKVITEGLTDSLKAGIAKIAQAIGAIWKKFLEAIDTLVKTDKAYLDKYKDIILKKQLNDATYTMYDYPNALKQVLNTAAVPNFNFDQMKDSLADDQTFINKYFNNYVVQGSKDPLTDQLKAKFRGSDKEITIKSTQLNMTDIFNFCYTYDTIKNNIDKDIKNIQTAANEGIKLIDSMVRNGQVQESGIYSGRDMYYSEVYETYLYEADTPAGNPQTAGTNNGSQKPAGAGAAKVQINQGNDQQNQNNGSFNNANQNVKGQANKNPDASVQNNTNNSDDVKNNRDKIMRYMRLCGQFLGAKESIFEEIYKNYMIIIKNHVRSTLGTEGDKSTNKPADQGTNYGNNNQNAQQDVDNAFNPTSK